MIILFYVYTDCAPKNCTWKCKQWHRCWTSSLFSYIIWSINL